MPFPFTHFNSVLYTSPQRTSNAVRTRVVGAGVDNNVVYLTSQVDQNERNRLLSLNPDIRPYISEQDSQGMSEFIIGRYQKDSTNIWQLTGVVPELRNDTYAPPAGTPESVSNSEILQVFQPSNQSNLKSLVGNIPPTSLPTGLIRNPLSPTAQTTTPPPTTGTTGLPLWEGNNPTAPIPAPPPTQSTTPPTADQQGGTPRPAPQPAPAPEPGSTPVQPATPATATATSYLSYPLKMKKEQDKIRFQAAELGTRESKEGNNGAALDFEFGERTFKLEKTFVVLPIQSSITDQNSVDWGPDSINAIDSSMYYKSLKLMNQEGSNLAREIGTYANQIAVAFKERSELTKRYLAGQAAGNNNILARTDGVILNPNLELLFTGPQLRPFSFQIKLSARDKDEAKVIKQIINYFKKNMAVKRDDDKLFLKAPNVFKISYLKWDSEKKDYIDHPGLNLIHPYGSENEETSTRACALTNCSVDYTPLGSYATYNDGTMVAYNISLQFQDIYPIYAEDYKDHPIGY